MHNVNSPRHQFFKYSLTLLFTLGLMTILFPFTRPILLAMVMAFALEPLVSKMTRSTFVARPKCAAWITIGAIAVVIAVFVFLGLYFYIAIRNFAQQGLQSNQTVQQLLKSKNTVMLKVEQALTKFDLRISDNVHQFIARSTNELEKTFTEWVSSFLGSIPELGVAFFIFCFFLYYFISQGRTIKMKILEYDLIPKRKLEKLLHTLQGSAYTAVVTSFITGLLQSSVVTIGCYIFGYRNPVIIFSIIFLLSYIPVIGAAPLPTIFGIFSLIQGETGNALGLFVVAAVAGSIDNIVRPYLVSKNEKGLHPAISSAAIIGSLSIFGLSGLFIGPVIASVTLTTLPSLFFAAPTDKERAAQAVKEQEEKMRLLKTKYPPVQDEDINAQLDRQDGKKNHNTGT